MVNVPTDHPTLPTALEAIGSGQSGVINIEAGHALTSGLSIDGGDYSRISITATDAVVHLASGFSGTVIQGTNAALPSLKCLIDATNQVAGNGVCVTGAARMAVASGCGVRNVYGTGLLALDGASVSAGATIWTGAARNGNTGAGITSWGAHVDAEAADVSGSHYYGAQAAHGGVLNFRAGKATNCARYGVRGSDAGFLNFDTGDASGAGVIGIYAFNGSRINARSAKSTGCGGTGAGGNVAATNNSHINGTDGIFAPGGFEYSIYCTSGSSISVIDAITRRFGSANANDMKVGAGGIIAANGANGGRNVSANTLTANGIIFV